MVVTIVGTTPVGRDPDGMYAAMALGYPASGGAAVLDGTIGIGTVTRDITSNTTVRNTAVGSTTAVTTLVITRVAVTTLVITGAVVT
jgi:hypothetical protein